MSVIQHAPHNGRYGNQIIRSLATSIISKKHNLHVYYSMYNDINSLGIKLFSGTNKYNKTNKITDDNFFEILNKDNIDFNIDPNSNFFQTKEITNVIFNYLHENKNEILNANLYKNRYENNNDLFVHVRATDAEQWNPGNEYFTEAIQKVNFENIYIASDDFTSKIVINIKNKYPNAIFIDLNENQTIMFGSTCKHIVLSHGSFSAIIGYLGFYSNVYYPKYCRTKTMWFGDMFSIKDWIEV